MARHESFLSAIPDIVAEIGADGTFAWLTQAGLDSCGSDALGRRAESYCEGDPARVPPAECVLNGDEQTVHADSCQRHPDGEKRLCARRGAALTNGGGNLTTVISMPRGIAEQRRFSADHLDAEARLRTFFDDAPIRWCMFDTYTLRTLIAELVLSA